MIYILISYNTPHKMKDDFAIHGFFTDKDLMLNYIYENNDIFNIVNFHKYNSFTSFKNACEEYDINTMLETGYVDKRAIDTWYNDICY